MKFNSIVEVQIKNNSTTYQVETENETLYVSEVNNNWFWGVSKELCSMPMSQNEVQEINELLLSQGQYL